MEFIRGQTKGLVKIQIRCHRVTKDTASNKLRRRALLLPTVCFCNGAVTGWHKVLSSFYVWFRGTGRGFEKAPLQKHKRCAQGRGTNRFQ
jgi:hypothetical protein